MTARKPSRLERADRKASDRVNQKRDSWPMRVVGTASEIGDQPQMRLICAATIAIGLFRRDSRLTRTGVEMLAAHTLATWGKSRIKAVVNRTRPDSGNDPNIRSGDSDAHEENSFPSGHSAGAVAVGQVVARRYPDHALAARGAALAVAGVQVPRGTHYLGDVLAGTLIGLAAEQAIGALSARFSRPAYPVFGARLQGYFRSRSERQAPSERSDGIAAEAADVGTVQK